jgi:FkbM family methyltransferase
MNRVAVLKAINEVLAGKGFVYVDCGARAGAAPQWLRGVAGLAYVGIEADAEECARLNARGRVRHVYLPAFLGRHADARTFRVTRHPACSSLLAPNHQMLARFADLGGRFTVEREVEVETVALENLLPAHGIHHVHFLELDTQGSELEVLAGAKRFLDSSVIGVQAEVEFAPMYRDQPLFGDIDAHLRARGFLLFDMSRYHVRRDSVERTVATRGQLLWGHALYLRDYTRVVESADTLLRLAAAAALLGIPDYTAEIVGGMLPLHAEYGLDHTDLDRMRRAVVEDRKGGALARIFDALNRSGLGGIAKWTGAGAWRVHEAYESVTSRRNYVWRN